MVFVCPKCEALVRAARVPTGCSVRCPKCGSIYRPRPTDCAEVYPIEQQPPKEPQFSSLVSGRAGSHANIPPRWQRDWSRGFNYGFGWLVGTVLAVACCCFAGFITYKVIEVGTIAYSKNQQGSQQGNTSNTGNTATNNNNGLINAPSSADNTADNQSTETVPPSTSDTENKSFDTRRVFCVTSAKFYFLEYEKPKPIIQIGVRNNTEHTLRRFSFFATLRSPDRKMPLANGYFEYTIDEGGLKPGEFAEWQLTPDASSEWGSAPRDGVRFLLKIEPTEVEDIHGNPLPESQIDQKGNPFSLPSDEQRDWI